MSRWSLFFFVSLTFVLLVSGGDAGWVLSLRLSSPLWQTLGHLCFPCFVIPCLYNSHLFIKCCVSFISDVKGLKPFASLFHWIFSQKFWESSRSFFFFGKCERKLCVLFGQRFWFSPWNSPMDYIFCSFSLWPSGVFCDLLDKPLMRSWSNFSKLATTGKVHSCSKSSPLWFAGIPKP